MKINSLTIKNYKSIKTISIKNVSNFTIFAGANGVGKSNIFEAIEFFKSSIELGVDGAIKNMAGGCIAKW